MTAATPVPTAAWPLPKLVRSLCRAGWGDDLDGRPGGGLRQTLHALVHLLPDGSAEGKATAAQVADAAGLSVRWTRRCLHVLEDMGLITWRRGGVVDGRPTPGWVRVCKTALAELARRTRGHLDARRKIRTATTHDRFKLLRRRTIITRRPRPALSVHAELSSPLHFPRGGTAWVPSPSRCPQTPTGDPMRTDLGTPCRICGLLREHCEAANRHVAHRYGHVYEPSTPKSVQLVARPAIEQARQAAPRGWRHPAPPPCPPPTLFGDAE